MEKLQAQINVKQGQILAHKSYLNATDYKVARAFETKTEIPPEDLALRAEAREAINTLEAEVDALIVELEELRASEILNAQSSGDVPLTD